MNDTIRKLPLPRAANIEPPPAAPIDYANLVAHDLAALMDLIEGAAFDNLKADIKNRGIQQRILLFEGRILDGRNRYRAANALGLKLGAENFEVFAGTRDDAEAQVISLNMQRRQMSNAQKEAVVQRMIKRYPDDSDRGIARRCGMTSHSQVGKVREKMEAPSQEAAAFEKFCKDFKKQCSDWPDHLLAEFGKRFHRELREMVSLAG